MVQTGPMHGCNKITYYFQRFREPPPPVVMNTSRFWGKCRANQIVDLCAWKTIQINFSKNALQLYFDTVRLWQHRKDTAVPLPKIVPFQWVRRNLFLDVAFSDHTHDICLPNMMPPACSCWCLFCQTRHNRPTKGVYVTWMSVSTFFQVHTLKSGIFVGTRTPLFTLVSHRNDIVLRSNNLMSPLSYPAQTHLSWGLYAWPAVLEHKFCSVVLT